MLKRLWFVICIAWTGIAILAGWLTYDGLLQYPSPDVRNPLDYAIGLTTCLWMIVPVGGKLTMIVVRYVMTGSPRKQLPYRYYRPM